MELCGLVVRKRAMWAELKESLSEESERGESEREREKVGKSGSTEDGNIAKRASDKNKPPPPVRFQRGSPRGGGNGGGNDEDVNDDDD
ncbi:hypothetical protein F2P81_019877 [Scophthalmus maximus]|uniref:Uncharacterized protein n=1 Tax=Scophthalmus maximus TaxID=52904 RepID=A0A6A4RWH8_SCOMX|nr:hypothetical protein F2P81_019877 [Scophthalmus maximus]